MAETPFCVHLIDRVPEGAGYGWNARLRMNIGLNLFSLLYQVCAITDLTPAVQWNSARSEVNAGDIVIYFLESRGRTKIAASIPPEAGGATTEQVGMLSEVYHEAFTGDLNTPRLAAVLTLHELMHNVLDAAADPAQRIVPDMHVRGGIARGGPGKKALDSNEQLSSDNITLLRKGLTKVRPQNTGFM
jgi:hypothetical protein